MKQPLGRAFDRFLDLFGHLMVGGTVGGVLGMSLYTFNRIILSALHANAVRIGPHLRLGSTIESLTMISCMLGGLAYGAHRYSRAAKRHPPH